MKANLPKPPAVQPSLQSLARMRPWLCHEELKPVWNLNVQLLEALVASSGIAPTDLPCALPPRDRGAAARPEQQ